MRQIARITAVSQGVELRVQAGQESFEPASGSVSAAGFVSVAVSGSVSVVAFVSVAVSVSASASASVSASVFASAFASVSDAASVSVPLSVSVFAPGSGFARRSRMNAIARAASPRIEPAAMKRAFSERFGSPRSKRASALLARAVLGS
jgi:hypothetical protein